MRRVAVEASDHRHWRIRHLLPNQQLHGASLESYGSLYKLLQDVDPEECYHLAARVCHAQDSFSLAKIKLGLASELLLGNLDAKRDWERVLEYVHVMWMMLQQSQAEAYVIGTG